MLVASTDPAHSLGDVLEVELGAEPVEVAVGRKGRLRAVEVAGPAAYGRWLGERREAFLAIAERGSLLDRAQAERLLALPMPGADELVGLVEVLRVAEAGADEEVVVDTAPTGHTLRLLSSPEVLRRLTALLAALDERHRVLAETFGGGEKGGPDDAREVLARLEEDARALGDLLRDPARSAFVWVSLPEALAVAEARHAFAELAGQGVPVAEVVVNRWPPAGRRGDAPRRQAERAAVEELVALAPSAVFRDVPERPAEPRGIAALRDIAAALAAPARSGAMLLAEAGERTAGEPVTGSTSPAHLPPPPWLDDLAQPGLALLFVGGKGGVGKTTCAAAIALGAAAGRPGREVRVVSVDPAHSLGDVLGVTLGDEPRPVPGAAGDLLAREVDAPAAWQVLRRRLAGELDRLLAWGDGRSGGAASLDRAALARLLQATPPGLDELVALVELAEAAGVHVGAGGDALEMGAGAPLSSTAAGAAPRSGSPRPARLAAPAVPPLVIVDTAPTGHALRLLEMPELALEWVHALMAVLLDLREALGLGDLAAELVSLSRRLKAFRALLADAERCRFLIVTRAGELPRRETERLAAALDRLGVALAGVVVDAFDPAGEEASGGSRPRPPRDVDAARTIDGESATGPARAGSAGGAAGSHETPSSGRPVVLAPAVSPRPQGVASLLAWGRTWRAAAL